MMNDIFKIIQSQKIEKLKSWASKQIDIRKSLQVQEEKGGKTPLLLALSIGAGDDFIFKLIELGADIHAVDAFNSSSLLWATSGNFKGQRNKILRFLLDNGVDPKKINKYGDNFINLLSNYSENEEFIIEMIDRGVYVDLNAKPEDNYSLFKYFENKKAKNLTIEYVLEKGVFYNEENKKKFLRIRLEALFI
jgi:ankyrin repeat protein